MHRNIFSLVCILGLPLAACDSGAPTPEPVAFTAAPLVLEGVWERAEVLLDSGPDAGIHLLDVQPSIYIFAKTHYGVAAVEGFAPRPYLSEEPTDAERGRALIPYLGEMGAYTNVDGKLKLAPIVTKDPAETDGETTREFDVVWDGIDVWLNSAATDGGSVKVRLTRVDQDMALATPDAQRLAGVWRRAEMVIGAGPDAGTHKDDAQPGFYIFTPRAFIGTYVSSFVPRPLLGSAPTDEAWGANYQSFVSFGGAYTLRDDVLVLRATVSQNPNTMLGRPFQAIDVKWEGEDVWFIYRNSAGVENRTRLVRVAD